MDRVEPPVSELPELGRDCYQRRRWGAAFDALSRADEIEPLAACRPMAARLVCPPHRTGRGLRPNHGPGLPRLPG